MTDVAANLSAVEDRWLAAGDAAAYLGVAVLTLSKWRLRGIGPRYSAALSRDPRYRLSDLVAFMNSKIVTNTVEARSVRRDSTKNHPESNYGGAAGSRRR